jgi:OmpA-OmpF porin, OOP family
MKKIVFLILGISLGFFATAQQNKVFSKRSAIGVHFSLTDFKTSDKIKSQGLNAVMGNGQWTKARLMSPGLALTYMKGLNNNIDLQSRLAGSFIDLPIANRTSFNKDNFFAEGDVSLLLKLLSDDYWVSPYLNVGAGVANYKSSYWSAFIPLGGGIQVNLFDEAFLLVNAQYRVPVTASNSTHFFYSFGVAGNIGKPTLRQLRTVN